MRTLQPVGLMGLDPANFPTHKTILDTFTGQRSGDRLPLRFLHLQPTHAFPKRLPSPLPTPRASTDTDRAGI